MIGNYLQSKQFKKIYAILELHGAVCVYVDYNCGHIQFDEESEFVPESVIIDYEHNEVDMYFRNGETVTTTVSEFSTSV